LASLETQDMECIAATTDTFANIPVQWAPWGLAGAQKHIVAKKTQTRASTVPEKFAWQVWKHRKCMYFRQHLT